MGCSMVSLRPLEGPFLFVASLFGKKTSNEPNLMKVGATRITTQHFSNSTFPVYNLSRLTCVWSETTRDAALVVGTPRWCMASDARNSRTEDLKTALPSAVREYGVRPAPFSCRSSKVPSGPNSLSPLCETSPSETALPSPSWPEK